MQWWAEFWYGVGRFLGYGDSDWGNAAEWFGAVASGAALIIAIVVFSEGQYRDARSSADSFHTSLWVRHSVGGDDERPVVVVHADNTGGTPIWLPVVYIRRDGDLKGYYQMTMYGSDLPVFPSGYVSQKGMAVTFAGVSRSRTFVRFRDGRNRWWVRHVESGKYARGLRKWWLTRQFAHIEHSTDRRRDLVPMRKADA